MRKLSVVVLGLVLMAMAIPALAQGNDARIQKLETSLQQMQAELAALKAQQQKSVSEDEVQEIVSKVVKEEGAGIPEWTKNLFNFKGDLRYRHEQRDNDSATDDRRRDSVRGRVTIFGRVNEETDLIMRITSGTETLTGEFADKSAEIDQMYVDWHPGSLDKIPFLGTGVEMLENRSPWYLPGQKGTHILAGKIPFPFYSPVNSTLLFDGQNLEGAAATVKHEYSDSLTVFGTGGAFWVDEQAAAADASLFGFQTGATIQKPVEGMDEIKYATIAAGWFNYGNIESGPVTLTSNSVNGAGSHSEDFDLLTFSGEIGIPMCNLPVIGYGEYVWNTAATTPWDKGYLAGVSIGTIANTGDWQFTYNFRDIEKDATVDAFNVGFGQGTDTKGHNFTLNYRLAKNVTLGATYYNGDKQTALREEKFDMLQLDLVFKF
ncbi:MAG: putative porin [Sedimentisphaerales bacterium]|nr:putative porin [Sedimentisphaerales bacterium]